MKRLFFLLCGLMTAFFYAVSSPVQFKQCVPASGSAISSFSFELQFDIEGALEEVAVLSPGDEFGIGYYGASKSNAKLYEGDPDTGRLLGTTMNKTFNGKSDGFVVNGSTISFSFDNVTPIPNQEYSIIITNKFNLYQNNLTTKFSQTELSFADNPLILKFVGASTSEATLYVENSKPTLGEEVDFLRNVEFYMNAPFTINSGAFVEIREGDDIIATSVGLRVSPDNDNCLIADFSTDVRLSIKHSYTVLLPAKSLSLKSDPAIGNSIYSIPLIGASSNEIKLASSKINYDDRGLPISADMIFDMPEGTSLNRLKNGIFIAGHLDAYLYEENNESNSIKIAASLINEGMGMRWDISQISWEPQTKYVLRKNENSLVVVDVDGNRLPDYTNKIVELTFTTPSLKELNYPPMEFAAPSIYTEYGVDSPYTEGMKVDNLHSIIFWLKDKTYYLDKNKYYLSVNPLLTEDQRLVYLYEIAPDGDKLLLSQKLAHNMDMSSAAQYGYTSLNLPLYEGKKYKLVIPEGSFTVLPAGNITDKTKCNLIKNAEIVLTFEGTTPEKCVLESCSIPDNSTVSNLYTVNWVFAGNYRLNDKISTVKCLKTIASDRGELPFNTEIPANVSTLQGKTYVYVDFIGRTTGQPTVVNSNTTYVLTIPKGMLINTVNDEIVNDEIVLTIKGGADEGEPETVWVNMTINGMHTTAHPAVKGKSYTFFLNPGTDWKITSVKNGSTNLVGTASDPKYPEMKTFVLPSLKGNTNVDAALEYNGTWAKEDSTTEVWTIEENNIRIYCDNNMIAVDGVTPENTINVYNVAGMFINSTRVSDSHDRVFISVPLNQTYIVSVDGVAAKIYVH